MHQAKRLCQLPQQQRLDFIAEGLPIILDSAQGFWAASQKLEDLPREAKVLEGFAEEEAAKILILVDAVRCPPKLISSKLNRIIGWFYDHLARLIYADAVSWKPMNFTQLREYVDRQRRGHYVEGYAGEYIMPNWAVYERESGLYADVEAYQDDTLLLERAPSIQVRSLDIPLNGTRGSASGGGHATPRPLHFERPEGNFRNLGFI